MSFEKVIAIFESLPPEQQTLIAGYYENNGQCCAIGKIAPSTWKTYSCCILTSINVYNDIKIEIEALGLKTKEATDLQMCNDNFTRSTVLKLGLVAKAMFETDIPWDVVDRLRFQHVLNFMKNYYKE